MTDSAEPRPSRVHERKLQLPDGRHIAMWRNDPREAVAGRVAILIPGFMRRMRHVGAFARYLTDNGFVVYRFDHVDHVGLSEGEIGDFTIGGMYDGLRVVHDHVLRAAQVEQAVLIPFSLAARPALRLAAETGGIAGIVGVVGVVDTVYTLNQVFGHDYSTVPPDRFGEDETVEFEGKLIGRRRFTGDWHSGRWAAVDETAKDVAASSCPIVNYCGVSDEWVSVDQVRTVLSAGGSRCRVVELPYVEHELSRNAVAAQTILREVTRSALEFTGSPHEPVHETGFVELATQVPYERNFERSR